MLTILDRWIQVHFLFLKLESLTPSRTEEFHMNGLTTIYLKNAFASKAFHTVLSSMSAAASDATTATSKFTSIQHIALNSL